MAAPGLISDGHVNGLVFCGQKAVGALLVIAAGPVPTVLGLAVALGLSVPHAHAQAQSSSLDEQVLNIPKRSGFLSGNLEATLFKPPGNGPFPLAIINHGKAPGDPKLQARFRPLSAARYFLQRGYVVLAPMRQGFSKSDGLYIGAGCNVESNGRTQAQDVLAALEFMSNEPYIEKSAVVVLGQSHGGWTTLALGALGPPPGVKGLVNFAGGLRQENCAAWEGTLARAAGGLAQDTTLPSLWFYGDNDSFFPARVWQQMYQSYLDAGGKAKLIAFGEFAGGDAHRMFGSREGEAIWQPQVTKFLTEIGLPTAVIFPQLGVAR